MEGHDRHALNSVSCTASSASPSSLRMESASVYSRLASVATRASNASSCRDSLVVIRLADPITPLLTHPEAILLTRDARILGCRLICCRARSRHILALPGSARSAMGFVGLTADALAAAAQAPRPIAVRVGPGDGAHPTPAPACRSMAMRGRPPAQVS